MVGCLKWFINNKTRSECGAIFESFAVKMWLDKIFPLQNWRHLFKSIWPNVNIIIVFVCECVLIFRSLVRHSVNPLVFVVVVTVWQQRDNIILIRDKLRFVRPRKSEPTRYTVQRTRRMNPIRILVVTQHYMWFYSFCDTNQLAAEFGYRELYIIGKHIIKRWPY